MNNIELTDTELLVIRHALDHLSPDRLTFWVDDNNLPITDEWLEQLDNKLNR